ncbi:MAG: YigZ family protein [Deltaproteobacteria bacterium]|nr:YigZ family protein [Deltaproteobacteria bacterium]
MEIASAPGHPAYLIPAETCRVEQEIKRSRFIATVGRAIDRAQAMAFINSIRGTYPDATHHCWAFVAGNPHGVGQMGMSDDGEPSGTAGKPILNILQHKKIGEIVAVVTRYFGGIKLGTGGLVRAYSSATQLAMDHLRLKEFTVLKTARITISYAYEPAIRRLLETMQVTFFDVAYTEQVVVTAGIPEHLADDVIQRIADRTQGSAAIEFSDK